MERLLFIWDELDDLVGLARHFGRNVSGDAQATWRSARASLNAAGDRARVSGLKFRLAAPNLPRR
jgi:hypothetical protein